MMNKCFSKFYVSVRRKHGSYYTCCPCERTYSLRLGRIIVKYCENYRNIEIIENVSGTNKRRLRYFEAKVWIQGV